MHSKCTDNSICVEILITLVFQDPPSCKLRATLAEPQMSIHSCDCIKKCDCMGLTVTYYFDTPMQGDISIIMSTKMIILKDICQLL